VRFVEEVVSPLVFGSIVIMALGNLYLISKNTLK